MIVNNILAIIQKELQSYFDNSLAYILAGVFWFISGLFFIEILLGEQGIIQQIALSEKAGVNLAYVDAPTELLNSFLATLGTLSLLIIPILSMGLYAEERKRGTLELLATSPITNWVVALSKLIAVTMLFIFMLLPSFFYETIAFSAATPSVSLIVPLLANLGLILMSSALLSLGMFISSLTTSNILAAILTFGLILMLWLIDLITNNISILSENNLSHVSLLESYSNLIQGIVNISDLVLFCSYIFLGLFLTSQSVYLLRSNRQ